MGLQQPGEQSSGSSDLAALGHFQSSGGGVEMWFSHAATVNERLGQVGGAGAKCLPRSWLQPAATVGEARSTRLKTRMNPPPMPRQQPGQAAADSSAGLRLGLAAGPAQACPSLGRGRQPGASWRRVAGRLGLGGSSNGEEKQLGGRPVRAATAEGRSGVGQKTEGGGRQPFVRAEHTACWPLPYGSLLGLAAAASLLRCCQGL